MDGKFLCTVANQSIGTIEPIMKHTIAEYSPEWTSIDIAGTNAYVYRGAYHYSLAKDPNMGACYAPKSGDCYTGYLEQCLPPYVWLGAGTSCSDYLAVELFPAPIYRFWSPQRSTHFYTGDEREKDLFLNEYADVWTPEGIAYCGHIDDVDLNASPVFRFWSETLGVYFYTISQTEADSLEAEHGKVWSYDGVTFYAYAKGHAPEGTMPVFRFWSDSLGCHFYTINAAERDTLIRNYPSVWQYEGIAWYAYLP